MHLFNQYLKPYPLVLSGSWISDHCYGQTLLVGCYGTSVKGVHLPFFSEGRLGNGSFSSINYLTLRDFVLKARLFLQ